MPYISFKTNTQVTNENEKIIKEMFGEAITIIPGKSEASLMVSIEDNIKMYLSGNNEKCAYIEVSVYKSSRAEYYDKMTEYVTKKISAILDILPDRIYVRYEETDNWGCNGHNFL